MGSRISPKGATVRLPVVDAGMRRIDDTLSVRDGRLFIEECDAADLERRFGTPVYLMSEDALRRNVRRFQRTFRIVGPRAESTSSRPSRRTSP